MIKNRFSFSPLLVLIFLSAFVTGCKKQERVTDPGKPQRLLKEYFDKKYLLYKLPADFYSNTKLNQSFKEKQGSDVIAFNPLGFDTKLNLQYTHVYSKECVYHVNDSAWKYAEVCFPNTCLTKDKAYADAVIRNAGAQPKTYFLRLFYQNTSYWYPTDDSMDYNNANYLQNYYGASETVQVVVAADSQTTVKIPYTIGMNPKHEFEQEPSYDPARPGNYEFMLLVLPDTVSALMKSNVDLKNVNPFAEIKQDELQNGGKKYFNQACYVGAGHFKFVFLDEYFDGVNDTATNHIYVAKDRVQKKLCDTCESWYRGVISEHWSADVFSKGFINKAPFVKADYGNRQENYRIDSNGVTLSIPKSKRGDYKKTWGEFIFGPGYKYGHLTVRAKFAQMFTNWGTPNGIIHNLWLYQRDYEPVDTSNPYHYMVNGNGTQPYEIDFEVWSSLENINTMWDDNAFINYAIVDYMRDANVQVKPGEMKEMEHYKVNRLNDRQLNLPGENLPRSFFNDFHTYELYWYPDHVRFLLDGKEVGIISKNMAKIPDKHMFLWIGSPMYQDGTYYAQSHIPFLKYDKESVIDYIKIE
ncbi:MAG: glycoside hydrolase family 16 protein [Bacteroidota bacterium]